MTIYTTVDDSYGVDVYRTFDALWSVVRGANYRTDNGEPLWLDSQESVRLTQAALKKELKVKGKAMIYETGEGSDWTLKIQKH